MYLIFRYAVRIHTNVNWIVLLHTQLCNVADTFRLAMHARESTKAVWPLTSLSNEAKPKINYSADFFENLWNESVFAPRSVWALAGDKQVQSNSWIA
jgi:hypothetical protein